MAPTFTRADEGGTLAVPAGEEFVLDLAETPTTGYRWHLDLPVGVVLVSSNLVPLAESAIGGGGTRRYQLKALAPGEFRLRAKLWREWAGDSSIIERCDFAIRAS